MRSAALVDVAEYLAGDYSPDVDYVDGVLEDRNPGEKDHSALQMRLAAHLFARREELNIHVYPELRIQISNTRFRVPDISVFAGEEPQEQIPTRAPFLCVEILSPEDRMTRIQTKIADYLSVGVRFVWVIDPHTFSAWIYTQSGATAATVLATSDPAIRIDLREIVSRG
jgi:Uma2 family endonuclease